MKPRPVGHGSVWPAHGYCESPPTFWAGWSGSQLNCETRTLPPTGTAPTAVPLSLYACSEPSMHVFASPQCEAIVVGSPLGLAARPSEQASVTAPLSPAATA